MYQPRTVLISVALLLLSICLLSCLLLVQRIRDTGKAVRTQNELYRIQNALTVYGLEQETIPGPDLRDLRDGLSAFPSCTGSRTLGEFCPMLVTGKDAWGQPLLYIVDADSGVAILRSAGANGRHENGGGDDIEIVYSQAEHGIGNGNGEGE